MNRWIFETLHPEIYHGFNRQAPYFEGWYYRLINAREDKRYAVIVGIFLGSGAHAFIQVLEGHTRKTAYHSFPIEQFQADTQRFFVRLGDNESSDDRLKLALDRTGELGQLKGELRFSEIQPGPVRWNAPGAMGFFGWLPFLECNHGVLSFNHAINGSLEVDGDSITFDGGRGYMEKDWGKSFLSAYIWMQSNHFDDPQVSLMASMARVPLLGMTMRGFIVGLRIGEQLYDFSTYSGARIEKLTLSEDHVTWILRKGELRLEIEAARATGGVIYGPTLKNGMGKRVDETLDASLKVRLLDGSRILFEGIGWHAGLEVNGEVERLIVF